MRPPRISKSRGRKVWQAQPEAGTTGARASAQGSGVCLGGGASKHLFWIHPAEDTLFGTAKIRGSRNYLDQTLGGGGGRGRNWLGMRQTCSWPLVKTRAFFPLSRKTPLPHELPQTGTSCILSWFPRPLPCQFQRPFWLMSKPRPDVITALPIKISRLQFKDCPD